MATKKRLIDANALVIEELLVMDRDYVDEFASGVRKVMNAIRRLPIVDAVEVVRCKDCKHWVRIDAHSGDCKNRRFALVGVSAPVMYDCEFCALGERKDND